MQFNFDYTKSYDERKKAVLKYQEECGLDNFNKDELEKLWGYVLYQYEKEINITKKSEQELDRKHFKALVDHENGIKSFISTKRGKKYTDHNYATYNEEIYEKNILRNMIYDTKDIINENIEVYENLKETLKNDKDIKDKLINNRILTSLSNIHKSINEDIADCRNGLVINNVNISEGIRSRHDLLSDMEVDYKNKSLIKAILKNWRNIVAFAERNPSNIIYSIYLDFKQAHSKVKLTDIQREILNNLLNGVVIEKKQYAHVDSIIKNFDMLAHFGWARETDYNITVYAYPLSGSCNSPFKYIGSNEFKRFAPYKYLN